MKKMITICVTLLLGVSMIACTNKQEKTNQEVKATPESSQEVKQTKEDTKNTFGKYVNLIGLSKREIINIMSEEPISIDEGGLEFSKAAIRVWFGDDGNTVNQIYMDSSDIDFNGARIGNNIEDFKNIFGKPVVEDTKSAYSNFDYKGFVLNVQYDSSTKKVVCVYLMKEWK